MEPDDTDAAQPETYQLTQTVVPLSEARLAFVRADPAGRIPLVVIPTRQFRIVNTLTIIGAILVVLGIAASVSVFETWTLVPMAIAGIAFIAGGILRSLIVPVPEAVSALLARGGKYQRSLSGGSALVAPWVAVSHLVTQREIPFEVLVVDAPTQDSVRMRLEALLTFTIVEPRNFVFNISTNDFDQVLQASCQSAVRTLVRQLSVDDVFNLTEQSTGDLREAINRDAEPYGVKIHKVKITFVQGPPDFQLTQEGQQLAILMRSEQTEKQALAERRQTDADALSRQRLLAQLERERDGMLLQLERAERERQLVEAEGSAEELRLSQLEDRLRRYPLAAEWDREIRRLRVARALAKNSRAVLQIGTADDISRVLVMQEMRRDDLGGAALDPNGAGLSQPDPQADSAEGPASEEEGMP